MSLKLGAVKTVPSWIARRCVTCDKVLVLTLVTVDRHEPRVELGNGRDVVLHDAEGTVGGRHNNLERKGEVQLVSEAQQGTSQPPRRG